MKTVREAIEEKIGRQVIIVGSNSSHYFGITVDEKGVLKYFTCDPDLFVDDGKIKDPVLHDYDEHEIVVINGEVRLGGYFGTHPIEPYDWDRKAFEETSDKEDIEAEIERLKGCL